MYITPSIITKHSVVRNDTDIAFVLFFTQFSPVVPSDKTIVRYHKDTGIETI